MLKTDINVHIAAQTNGNLQERRKNMANIYGTAEYEKYLQEYRNFSRNYVLEKTDTDETHYETNGIRFDIVSLHNFYSSNEGKYCWHNFFNEITITVKDGRSKQYNTIELLMKPTVFRYNEIDYIFFRKTIFGYCIIDSRNFEEYNYFPSIVREKNEEAFISCEVYCLKDLLIIVGCYWGGPYELYVLDLDSKKTIGLFDQPNFKELEEFDLGNGSIKLSENGFTVINANGTKECSIAYAELKNVLKQVKAMIYNIKSKTLIRIR